MTLNYSTPVVNPRLGSGFAIFASTYTCLVLLLIVLEQLGLPVQTIDSLIVTMPALFYIAIGFMTRTTGAEDFFLAGQRVPPFYNALALCGTVFGGSILLGSIGAFFFVGIDALAIVLGCFAGLILTGVLFVPHLRKAGANTLPGFLHLRFGRSRVRFVAALLMIAPAVIVLVAEVALGGKILGYLLPLPQIPVIGLAPASFYVAMVCACLFLTVALGGMRSATWTQGAQFIVVLGILAPLISVSVMRTNLPLPQLTYGAELEELNTLEAVRGLVAISQPEPLSESLPRPAPAAILRPSERAFSAFSEKDFLLLVICLAAGVAANPAFIPRLSTTPTILSTRRSLGWVAVIGALVVLTIPAYAFFTKAMAVEALVGVPMPSLPAWSRILQHLGLVTLPGNQFDPMNAAHSVTFQRDSLALILPIAGGLPRVFFGLAAASALAAIAASASAQLVALANSVSDDLYAGFLNKPRRRPAARHRALHHAGSLRGRVRGQPKPERGFAQVGYRGILAERRNLLRGSGAERLVEEVYGGRGHCRHGDGVCRHRVLPERQRRTHHGHRPADRRRRGRPGELRRRHSCEPPSGQARRAGPGGCRRDPHPRRRDATIAYAAPGHAGKSAALIIAGLCCPPFFGGPSMRQPGVSQASIAGTARRQFYPELEPYNSGWLKVSGGHEHLL